MVLKKLESEFEKKKVEVRVDERIEEREEGGREVEFIGLWGVYK